MKAHFIGIAGKGMSATALLLREQGWEITGSDEGFYPPVSTYLTEAGIGFAHGYRKENIPADVDRIIIGKNAKLIPETNAEVQAALESGVRVCSFPDILEELTENTDNIIVAGSYGKSTSTALLAWCLKEAGKDPSYFIGEITKGFTAHAHKGASDVFVLEGDEYPSSNWDPRSKFLHYHAKNILLTSATHDHINIYPTHADYLAPFRALIASLPANGLVVANGGEEHARALTEEYTGTKVFYGIDSVHEWHPTNIGYGETTTFDLMKGDELVISISTTLLGTHNIENIVGVCALLLEKKLLTPAEVARGVASFQGVKRRLELLSPGSRIPVLEGFGSSYEKARSALVAMKNHYANKRILVVFEPHTFSWRNRQSIGWYDSVFAGADIVYIYEPATQGHETHAQLSQAEIVARITDAGFSAFAVTSAAQTLNILGEELKEDDTVLLLTSGNLDGLIETIPALVEKKFPIT
ncbi:MAG: Mur ligase family protein [Candidatus Adlerbacteria bacterium]